MQSEVNAIRIAKHLFPHCFQEECKAFGSIRYRMKGIKAIRVLRENPPKGCSDLYRVEVEYKNLYAFENGKWVEYHSPYRATNLTEHVVVVQRNDIKKNSSEIGQAMQNVFCANVLILRIYTGQEPRKRDGLKDSLRYYGVHVFFVDELEKQRKV